MKLVIATGGTGGHVIPAMHLEAALKDKESVQVLYLGVGLEKNAYFHREGRNYCDLAGGNFAKGVWRGLRNILRGFLKARQVLKQEKIERVIGFGSYHSLPPLLAAWSLGIPFDVVELNILPGKINQLFSKWADGVYLHFAPAKDHLKGRGKLIDLALDGKKQKWSKKEARHSFGLNENGVVFLIFGGSQGAQSITNAWLGVAKEWPYPFQVVHITPDVEAVKANYQKLNIPAFVAPFIEDMARAFVAADLAICRAGAGALRETLLYSCPGIFIPFPHAMDGHQEKNAHFMEKVVKGGVCLLETPELERNLKETLKKLFINDEKKLCNMRSCLRTYYKKEHREPLASLIFSTTSSCQAKRQVAKRKESI